MSNKSSYPLKLPRSVKSAAERLARADGVSLNQFIAAAVAEKVGTLDTVDRFLERRSEGHEPADLHAILDAVPDADPVEGDGR